MHKTPLHDAHAAIGAKMVLFEGWDMPIQYTTIIDEHLTVRKHAGAFDVSHMGAFVIRGEGAGALMNHLSTNDILSAPLGRCVYTHMLNDSGMILDDTIITVLGENEFFMVPNAGTVQKMGKWIEEHLRGQELKDESLEIAKIAVQGPAAKEVMAQLTSLDLSNLKWFWGGFMRMDKIPSEGGPSSTVLLGGREMLNGAGGGTPAFVSRTGYTGEDGFEIFCENADAVRLWDAILERGGSFGLKPIGLGARDTLRLEKALLLSGTDFDGNQSSLQTGPKWVIDGDHEFIGKEDLVSQKDSGSYDKLVCMMCEGRGIPRHGYAIRSGDAVIGTVTSGTMSPLLRKGIAMGYVPLSMSKQGYKIEIEVRETIVPAEIVKPPFVK
jgi:aminomethyltransferase